MIRIFAIDDQPEFLDLLTKEVKCVSEILKIDVLLSCYTDVKCINFSDSFDIFFLDIEMPEKSGFEISAEFTEKQVKIVYVTAIENYVFKSFEYEPFRFIRKSHLDDELEPALLAAVDKHLRAGKTFLVDSTSGKLEIRHKDILYFESSHNYLVVHTVGGRNYSFRSTLTTLEEKLKGEDFCRIHHAYIVYLPSIKRIEGSASVIMKDNTMLPISARQKNVFKEAYIEYTNRRFAK